MVPSVNSPGDPRIQGPCRRIVLCNPLVFPFNHNVHGKFKCGGFGTAVPVICYPSAKWRQRDLSKCGNNFHFHLHYVRTPVWDQEMLFWRDAPVSHKILTWRLIGASDVLLGLEFLREWKGFGGCICAVYKQAFFMGERIHFLLPLAIKFYNIFSSETFTWI